MSKARSRLDILSLAGVMVAVSLVLVLSTQRGWWVLDNKFILYWNPGRGLSESFTTWLAGYNLGATRSGFSPATFAYVWVLRTLGASPWLAERLFHATLMAAGGLGVALVCRAFQPGSRIGPLVAGLWWVASPFTVGFLMPSWLYLQAALGPWLLFVTYKGVTTKSLGRWAGAFALLVFMAGSLNPPGLLLAGLPLLPLIAYLVMTRQVALRRVLRFLLVAGALALLVYLPSLTQLAAGSQLLSRNLSLTESAATVSQSSSWPESLRGLGGWLLYFNFPGQTSISYVRVFFTNPPMLALTVLPLLTAVWVIGWTRWRFRVLFGLILLTSAVAMVGAFPYAAPPPWGWLVLRLYEWVPSTFTLRSTYKAGPGVVLAVGVLAGIGIEAAYRRLAARSAGRVGVIAAVAVVLIASSSPFWTGGVYGPNSSRVRAVPSYWFDATAWLDAQADSTRAMILPNARVPAYTWGTPGGGDIFPSLLRRTFMLNEVLAGGSPTANNVVAALSLQLSSGQFEVRGLAPVASRLGIGYIVIRNDLDPVRAGSVAPSVLDAVRSAPDVELVATFGAPGQNVARGDGAQTDARPPVEIFRVRGVDDTVRVVPDQGSVVVSGDGEAWLGLSAAGPLDGSAPLQYSGQLDRDRLAAALRDGSSVWVTDTNRRRQLARTFLTGPTLPSSTNGVDLFGDPATQSVAVYGDASSIVEVNAARLIQPPVARRPAAATDGDPSTAWLTGSGLPFAPQGLRVNFPEPKLLSGVQLVGASGIDVGRRVVGADLVMPDGQRIPFQFDGRTGAAPVVPLEVPWFDVVITRVEGDGLGGYGIAEIAADGLDLRESIRVPTDVADDAAADSEIAALLRNAEFGYRFARLQDEPLDPESALRRRFLLPSDRSFAVAGAIRATPSTTDDELAASMNLNVTAVATARAGDELSGSGLYAADDDLTTGWAAPPDGSASLDVTFPPRPVRTVTVVLDGTAGAVRSVEVSVPDGASSSSAVLAGCAVVDEGCTIEVSVPIAAGTTDRLSVRVSPVDPAGPPPRVLEVRPDGIANPLLPSRLADSCLGGIVAVDGVVLSVAVDGDTATLLSGEPVAFRTCDSLDLAAGWHDLDAAGSLTLDRVEMRSEGRQPSGDAAAGMATVTGRSSTAMDVTVDSPDGGWLTSGMAATPGWRASTTATPTPDGATLDLQSAFRVPAGTTAVDLRYVPQDRFVLLAIVSLGGLVICLLLVISDPRRRKGRDREPVLQPLPVAAQGAVRVAFVLVCTALAGLAGALLGVGLTVALRHGWLTARTAVLTALVLLVAAYVVYMPPFGPDLQNISSNWVSQRAFANSIGRVAALFLTGGVFELLLVQMRPERPSSEHDQSVWFEDEAASSDGMRSSTTSDHDRL